MKKRTLTISALALLATVALGTAGVAAARSGNGCGPMGSAMYGGMGGGMHRGMGGPMAGGMRHMLRMAEELELSKAQRDQIWALMSGFRERMHAAMEGMLAGREAMRGLNDGDGFDAGKARAAADQQGKAMAEMMVMRAEMMARLQSVLTPEQAAKLKSMRGRHGGHRGFGRHGRMPMGAPGGPSQG